MFEAQGDIARCLHLLFQVFFARSTGHSLQMSVEASGHFRLVSPILSTPLGNRRLNWRCHNDVAVIVTAQLRKFTCMSRNIREGAPEVNFSTTQTILLHDSSTTNTNNRLMSTKAKMAPTTKFYLPDDDTDTETEGYSSETRNLNPTCSSEVPRSLLVENYHTHQNTETEIFPLYIERMPEPTKVIKGFVPAMQAVEPAKEEAKEEAKEKTYTPVPLGTSKGNVPSSLERSVSIKC